MKNTRKVDVDKMNKNKVMITNNQKEIKIPTGLRLLVRRCCNAVLLMEKFEFPAEISVSFVNNEQIRELNREYRNKDMPTDVSVSYTHLDVYKRQP